jgi:hypothetical protein
MANIRLKELLEANVDPKLVARSKESGKLVYFKTQQAKDAALQAGSHLDPKAKKGGTAKAATKPNDMFGGDYAKDRGGETPTKLTSILPKDASDGSTIKIGNTSVKIEYVGKNKDYIAYSWEGDDGESNYEEIKVSDHKDMNSLLNRIKDEIRYQRVVVSKRNDTSDGPKVGGEAPKADPVTAVASRAQMVPKAVAGWADKNSVDLSKVSDDLNSGKLNVFDFMTAVTGIPGNKYAKAVIAKYSQSDSNTNYSQSVKQDIDGQTDDELYDALYDMGYDFGELGSDDFDEEGFADAAMNLGYRYDDKNKVWNHRDDMDDTDGSDVDGQDDEELYNALSDMGYDFGKFGSKNFDEKGFADAAMNLGYRYDDKNKVWNHRDTMDDNESPKINSKNWKKTDGDGRMSSESADDVRNYLNNVLGVDGVAEVDFGSGNIQYGLSDGENSIYVGNDGGTYNVSFEGPSMDIDKIEQSYKSFKNPKDALLYAGELAKANRKGLEQKQESTKLTSMIKR